MTALNITFRNAQHHSLLILASLFAFIFISGSCIYVPIPANSLRSPKGVIPDQLIDTLKAGETKREDLLLLAAEPDSRHENDRYFIYEWEVSEAIVAVPGGGSDVYIKHFLCVEFDGDNKIKRFEHFKSGLFKSTTKVQQEVDDWMNETGP